MNKETYYKEMREQKIAAGLRAEQADEVVKRQRAEDDANGVHAKPEKEVEAVKAVTTKAPKAPKTAAAAKAPAEAPVEENKAAATE